MLFTGWNSEKEPISALRSSKCFIVSMESALASIKFAKLLQPNEAPPLTFISWKRLTKACISSPAEGHVSTLVWNMFLWRAVLPSLSPDTTGECVNVSRWPTETPLIELKVPWHRITEEIYIWWREERFVRDSKTVYKKNMYWASTYGFWISFFLLRRPHWFDHLLTLHCCWKEVQMKELLAKPFCLCIMYRRISSSKFIILFSTMITMIA